MPTAVSTLSAQRLPAVVALIAGISVPRLASGGPPGAQAAPRPGAQAATPPATQAAPKKRRLTLAQVIDLARHSPQVEMARDALRAAQARVDEARGARFPSLSVTSFAAPSPKITCQNPECTITEPRNATVAFGGIFAGVRLQATEPIYTFGKIDSAETAARAGAKAAGHLENAAAGDVVVEAARAYYGLKLAREILWMLEDGKSEIDDAVKKIEAQIAKGSSSVTLQDRFRVETLRAEVEARLTESREAEAKALAGIRALAGSRSVDIDQKPLETVTFHLAGTVEPYLERARARNPELRAARAGAVAERALADLEHARIWPDLAVVGGANTAFATGVDKPPSAFADNPFNTGSLALGLALTWKFDPVSEPARIRRARAEADRALARAAAAKRLTDYKVEQVYAAAVQAKKRVAAAQAGQKAAKAWVASVLQSQALGIASSKDLADAYIAYFTLRTRALSAIYDYNLATFRLRRLLGEFPGGG